METLWLEGLSYMGGLCADGGGFLQGGLVGVGDVVFGAAEVCGEGG